MIAFLSVLWATFVSFPVKTEGGTISGAYFGFDGGRVVVFQVVRGSPAYLGGLSVGDVVLSVDGRPALDLGNGMDLSMEMDLLSDNSVLLEVLKETGYKNLVWIKTPILTVHQKRFLSYYTDFRFLWEGLQRDWWEVVQSYRFYLEGSMSLDLLSSHAKDLAEEIHDFRNRLLSDGPPDQVGEEWEHLKKAREYMISSVYLMDQEVQRMPSEGQWKVKVDGIKKRISAAEKHLTLSLNYAGINDTKGRTW